MADRQVEQEAQKRSWRQYLLIGTGILLTVLLAVAIVYFWEEIQHAKGYGYAGGFVVSVLGGVTVIPAPSLVVVFALGGVLTPAFVGLISGFGEALGGLTIYLTGAGGGAIWSRLRSRQQVIYDQPTSGHGSPTPVKSKVWSRGQAFYNRLAKWVGGRRGSWLVFIVAAMPLSPFYFAGLAAGTLRIGLLRFFLLSWAGKTIKGMTIAFAGYWGLSFVLPWFGG